MATKKKFRLLIGTHVEASTGSIETGDLRKGPEYTANDIVESAGDLVKMFPNKFQLLSEEAARVGIDPDELERFRAWQRMAAEQEASPKPEEVKKDAIVSELGEDVTSTFPLAAEAELSVFRKDGKFFIAEPEAPNKALNDEPLELKNVKRAITKYLKEE